jgi:uncharacterized protein YdaT
MTKETTHPHHAAETPIVVETKKHKKKFSNGATRSLQEFEDGVTKSAQRISKAVQAGLDAYEAARKHSADAKKDGAFRDYLHNQSKALRKALPLAAEAPSDLIDAIADMKVVRDIFHRKGDED